MSNLSNISRLLLLATALFARVQGQCQQGFLADPDTGACQDIDECKENNGGCDARTVCYNTVGSRQCGECPKDNYIGDGETGCVDINECALGQQMCDPLTKCANVDGGYTCTKCPEGFSGSGRQGCEQVNECELEVAPCSPMVQCIDLTPQCDDLTTDPVLCSRGFRCTGCPEGYQGDGIGRYGCVDVNECKEKNWFTHGNKDGTPPCGVKPCKNLPGTFECEGFDACEPGYVRDESTGDCLDIDECQGADCLGGGCPENGGCKPLTQCINLPGTSTCSDCPDGYEERPPGSGNCEDINECLINNGGCDARAECFNVNGTGGAPNHCGEIVVGACPVGFRRPNQNSPCIDINECALNNPCHFRTQCMNTPGSFYCTDCPFGFIGTGMTTCEDIDECKDVVLENGDCDPLVVCTNTVPNRTCGACPNGYTGNGYDGCIDIDECSINNGGCANGTWCINRPGTYECGECPNPPPPAAPMLRLETRGGQGACVDIDECQENTHKCHHLSTCRNLQAQENPDGSFGVNGYGYTCTGCPEGYSGGGWNNVMVGDVLDLEETDYEKFMDEGCVDKNECEIYGEKLCNGFPCVNVAGSYRCEYGITCPLGQKVVGEGATLGCVDINECIEGVYGQCAPGDLTCDPENGGCDVNVQCNNLIAPLGTRSCGPCPDGYIATKPEVYNSSFPNDRALATYPADFDGPALQCEDINECEFNNGGCNPLQVCINQVPHFRCEDCAEGYTKDPILGCRDIDECSEGLDNCNDLAPCLNLNGTYICRECQPGYRFKKGTEADSQVGGSQILGTGIDGCEDVDECEEERDNCDYSLVPPPLGDGRMSLERCKNTIGGFVCLPWNASQCTGPTAIADTPRPEVSGILGLTRVGLYADKSIPGSSAIKSYFWSLVEAPEGAQPRLTSTTAQTAFVGDLNKAGDYVFQLAITDMCGEIGRAQVTIKKILDERVKTTITVDPVVNTIAPDRPPGPPVGEDTASPAVDAPPTSEGDSEWTRPRTRAPTAPVLNSGVQMGMSMLLWVSALIVHQNFV